MKQTSKNMKIVTAVLALLMITAIIITLTIGFNVEFKFRESQEIELDIAKEFEISDIKQIAKEVLKDNNMISKVGEDKTSAQITAKQITEEQKTEIVNKINEKYQLELKAEDINIVNMPQEHLRDMLKPYIAPFVIAAAIIAVYMVFRYHKIGVGEVIMSIICDSIIAQAVLFSIITITRIPVGRLTIPMVIIVFILTLVRLTTKYEKELVKIKEENKE